MTYEEMFEDRLRPPLVPPSAGSKLLEAREPVQILELDAGAFRALWELVEAEAKFRFPTHETLAGTRALFRAVESFRGSYWDNHDAPPKPEVRKLKRGSDAAIPAPSMQRPASPGKHVIRRPVNRPG